MTRHLSIHLAEATRNIPLCVGSDALAQLSAYVRTHYAQHRICAVVDSKVLDLHSDALRRTFAHFEHFTEFLTVAGGEASKSRAMLEALHDQMLAAGFGRDTLVIAVGGGVIGDLVGFAAATLHRGLPFIQVPTTVLAQVDASIGGKVGINHPRGKNLLGAFHQPVAIFSDVRFLATLEPVEFTNGMAEVIKIAAVADPDFVSFLEAERSAILQLSAEQLSQAIVHAADLKSQVVMSDELETGRRAILNFGHTAGHALEALSSYKVKHGFAVAAGMRVALQLSRRLRALGQVPAQRITELLADYSLDTVSLKSFDSKELWQVIQSDKKVRGGRPRFVLLSALGLPAFNLPVTYEEFADAIAAT